MVKMTHRLSSCFERSGYKIEVKDDIQEFAALRSNTPDHVFLGPTFDPEKSDQTNSKWMLASTEDGKPAAFVALRRFDTPSLNELIRTCRIWYDHPETGNVEFLKPVPPMRGTCYYRGGMYVYPNHRKSGLAWGLAMYGQAIAQEEGGKWIFANAFPEIVEKGIPFRVYGFETCYPQKMPTDIDSSTSDSPMAGREGIFYLLTCSRSFFSENISCVRNILVSRRNYNLLDTSLTYERNRLPQKQAGRVA